MYVLSDINPSWNRYVMVVQYKPKETANSAILQSKVLLINQKLNKTDDLLHPFENSLKIFTNTVHTYECLNLIKSSIYGTFTCHGVAAQTSVSSLEIGVSPIFGTFQHIFILQMQQSDDKMNSLLLSGVGSLKCISYVYLAGSEKFADFKPSALDECTGDVLTKSS